MKKRSLWIGLVTMLFMFVAIGTVAMAASSQAYTAEQYAEFKSNGTYPTAEGQLFGGWFADDTLATVYTGEAGETPTAKFADKDILGVKYQISGGATAASASVKVRVVTSVDNLNYNRVGFIITTDAGLNRTVSIQDVYQTLTGYDGVEVFSYNPTVFSAESTYFAACIFTIPQSQFDTVLHIQPFWKTLDGTIVTGTVRDVSVSSTPGFSAIAKIGADEFYYLQDAVEAATDGDTIELLSDPTVDATIAISKNLTITGDGYTVTHGAFDGAAFTVASGKTLTIGNGTDAITLDGNGTGKALVDATGTLSVKGGATLKGKVDLEASATLTVAGDCKVGIADGTADSGVDFSGAVTVTGDNVAADAEVVLKDSLNLTVNGTGSEEAFTILEPHNKVGKVSGDFSLVANMCVCGATDGLYNHTTYCYQPSVWQPWSAEISKARYGGGLAWYPNFAGAFYLIDDLQISDSDPESINGITISWDLNGHTLTGKSGASVMFRPYGGGTLNIADSVGTGEIVCSGAGTGSTGRIIYMWPNGSTQNVNLFGGTLKGADGATGNNGLVSIWKGNFRMLGGTILPLAGATTGNANAVDMGNGDNTTYLSVFDGTIKGEVLLRTTKANLYMYADSEIGISDGSGLEYGLFASVSTAALCYDVTGTIVLKDTEGNVALSGTGKGSVFTSCRAGHNRYGVSGADDDTIGSLTLCKALMCVCGRVGDHVHNDCALPDTAWKVYPSNMAYLPLTDKGPGHFYLTGDMTITDSGALTSGVWTLDLNGHTVRSTTRARMYGGIRNDGTRFNLCDSVGTGQVIVDGTSGTAYAGRFVWIREGGLFNMYGGTITDTANAHADDSLIYFEGGNFGFYGGTIRGRNPIQYGGSKSWSSVQGKLGTVETVTY